MSSQIGVLFVCLGNICRSPMAEAIFRNKVEKKGVSAFFLIDSAGTSHWHRNENPDYRTLQVLRKNQISTQHVGRQLVFEDSIRFQYIFAMDHDNVIEIKRICPESTPQLIREFDNKGKGIVPDPYYGSQKDFEYVYEILDRCMQLLLDDLIDRHQIILKT